MSFKAALFDKDGTLFGYGQTWRIWCENTLSQLAPDDTELRRKMAAACGFDWDKKIFLTGSPVVNATADEVNALWAPFVPHLTLTQIEATGLDCLADLPLQPVCDLHAVMSKLSELGLSLGVATNDFASSAETQLKTAGVHGLFDFICGYDSGFGAKPGPGMIQGFARSSGCDLSEVVMVGDSTHDLKAGRNAGAGLCVGVLTGPAEYNDLVRLADVVLPSIEELPGYLNKKTT